MICDWSDPGLATKHSLTLQSPMEIFTTSTPCKPWNLWRIRGRISHKWYGWWTWLIPKVFCWVWPHSLSTTASDTDPWVAAGKVQAPTTFNFKGLVFGKGIAMCRIWDPYTEPQAGIGTWRMTNLSDGKKKCKTGTFSYCFKTSFFTRVHRGRASAWQFFANESTCKSLQWSWPPEKRDYLKKEMNRNCSR